MLENASVVDECVLPVGMPGTEDTVFHLKDDTAVVTVHGHGRLDGLPKATVFGDAIVTEEVVSGTVLDEADINGGLVEEISDVTNLDDALGSLEEWRQVDEVEEHHDEHEEVPEGADDAAGNRARRHVVALEIHGGDHVPGRVAEVEALALLGGRLASLRLGAPFVGAEVADEEEEDA